MIGTVTRGGALKSGYVLLDFSLGRIVTYDSAGRHVRTAGRSGAGPGEFRMLLDGVSDSAGERIAVLDPQRSSLSSVSIIDTTASVSRFPVPPSISNFAWCCGDSLLVFVPFGRPGVVGTDNTLLTLFKHVG